MRKGGIEAEGKEGSKEKKQRGKEDMGKFLKGRQILRF
jgi:hypothetical protein